MNWPALTQDHDVMGLFFTQHVFCFVFLAVRMVLCRIKKHTLLVSLVTNAVRQLVGVRLRVCYHWKKEKLPCPGLHRNKVNTMGYSGVPESTRKMLNLVHDPKSRVTGWECTGRWWDKPDQSPDVTDRRKTWEAERGKQLGLWEIGPRETPVAPLDSISWAQLGFWCTGYNLATDMFFKIGHAKWFFNIRQARVVRRLAATIRSLW